MTSILVVDPENLQRELIKNLILDEYDDFLITTERHLKSALKNFDNAPSDIAITALEIDRDGHTPRQPDENVGLQLAKELASRNNAPRVIIISADTSEELRAQISQVRNCCLMMLDKVPQTIVSTVENILSPKDETKAADKADALGFIEITIDRNRQGTCQVWTPERGSGKPIPETPVPLSFSETTFNDIIYNSSILEKLVKVREPEWLSSYKQIGEKIKEEMTRDIKLLLRMDRVSRVAGHRNGVSNVHLTFVADKEIDRLPFESLIDWDIDIDDGDHDFLLLKGPVYRRVHGNRHRETRGRRPLISSSAGTQKNIKCLIIDASTGGLVDNYREEFEDVQLPYMTAGKGECDQVFKMLDPLRNDPESRIADVALLTQKCDGSSFVKRVEDALTQGDWNFVHFCGHSHFRRELVDPVDKSSRILAREPAYLIFPENSREYETNVAVPIGEVSRWMDETRFLYLSSCHSGERGIAYKLAEQVPEIVSFRWELDDEHASDFAKEFYKRLFCLNSDSSLETAYFETQYEMHNIRGSDPIWAAPVLIVQHRNFGA